MTQIMTLPFFEFWSFTTNIDLGPDQKYVTATLLRLKQG
jgi:hypothetical protein